MYRRFGALLRAPEGEGGSGGGGGAGDGSKGAEGAKAAFSEEQFVAIGEVVNKALSSRLPKMVSGGVAEAMKAVDWKSVLSPMVSELIPKPDASGSGGGSGTDASKSKSSVVDSEIAKQLKKLSDDLETEKKARLEAVRASEELKAKHEFESGRQKLYEALKPHASEMLHDVWVDHLVHHNRLKIEKGVPLLEVEHAPIKGMPKQRDFLPLDEAVPLLVATDDAKRFQPAPDGASGAGGNGNPGPRGRRGAVNPSLTSQNPLERVAARLEAMGVSFDNEFGS